MSFIRRHPFLTLAVPTALGFIAVEAGATWLAPTVRILIMPMWLIRTIEMALGFGALPTWFNWAVGLPLLFLSYLAFDALLTRRSKFDIRAS